jgi:hypothetical protein
MPYSKSKEPGFPRTVWDFFHADVKPTKANGGFKYYLINFNDKHHVLMYCIFFRNQVASIESLYCDRRYFEDGGNISGTNLGMSPGCSGRNLGIAGISPEG